MKALSIQQPWASMIANGRKTIETRTWYTSWRGVLLICASKSLARLPDQRAAEGLPLGCALATAELYDCRRMIGDDCAAAQCELYDRAYSLMLRNIRRFAEPIPLIGNRGLFDVPDDWLASVARFADGGPLVRRATAEPPKPRWQS